MLTDIKAAFRSLLRAPGYCACVVLMLGFGLGAAGALHRAVRDSLDYYRAYADSSRLVRISLKAPESQFAYPLFLPRFTGYREAKSLLEIAGVTGRTVNAVIRGEPKAVFVAEATANFFSLLGVTPVLGRGFLPEEGLAGRNHVALLTHWFWQSDFGGAPSVVGQSVRLGEEDYTIVGVLPRDFNPPLAMSSGPIYVPCVLPSTITPERVYQALGTVARLRADTTVAAAEAELRTLRPERGTPYEKSLERYAAVVEPLGAPVQLGQVRRYELMQRTGAAAVGILYVIASVNVAGLMLVRMLRRRRELAIRLSLGGSRWAVFRLLLCEAWILTGLAAVLGVLLAKWLMPVLLAMDSSGSASMREVGLEPGTFALLIVLALLSGLVITLVTTWALGRADLNVLLQDGGAAAGESRNSANLRSGLVVVEIAMAMVLLVGAGLMVRTFHRLQEVNPGYDPARRFSAQLDYGALRVMAAPARRQKIDEIKQRLEGLPGVSGVAVAYGAWGTEYYSPGKMKVADPTGATGEIQAQGVSVSDNFVAVLGLPVKLGRSFADWQVGDPRVVVINEAMARAGFAGRDPRGSRLIISPKEQWEIIGVVGDTRSLHSGAKPMFFYPDKQADVYAPTFLLRTAGTPAAGLAAEVRRAVYELDPKLVIANFQPLQRSLDLEITQQRRTLGLLRVLSGFAFALALAGLTAMMTFTIAQRLREIGVRLALGATPASIPALVVKRGVLLVGLGIAAGAGLAAMLTRFLQTLLFETQPHDALTYSLAALLLLLAALLACWIPAWRAAAGVDLAKLLRSE